MSRDDWLWEGGDPPDAEDTRLVEHLSALRRERPCPPLPARPERPRLPPRWRLPAAGAILLLAAAAWLTLLRPSSDWRVTPIRGSRPCWVGPCGWRPEEVLVTGAGTAWRVALPGLGAVQLHPGSRLGRLDGRQLRLDEGQLDADILAGPGVFQVHTPAARVVDLGCAFHLVVSPTDTQVDVRVGAVALENAAGTSFVSAGSTGSARLGHRPGLPVRRDAGEPFRAAAAQLDATIEQRGDVTDALAAVLAQARPEDSFTLWQLLPLVPEPLRAGVLDALVTAVPGVLPTDRAAVLALDPAALRMVWLDLAPAAYRESPPPTEK